MKTLHRKYSDLVQCYLTRPAASSENTYLDLNYSGYPESINSEDVEALASSCSSSGQSQNLSVDFFCSRPISSNPSSPRLPITNNILYLIAQALSNTSFDNVMF